MRRLARAAVLAAAISGGFSSSASAEVMSWNFEPGWFTAGAPFHGQAGWSMTGPFDVAVAGSAGTPGFGSFSLRVSNQVANPGFDTQPVAPSLTDPAGETSAFSLTGSTGDRQPSYELRLQFRSAAPASAQPGLQFQVAATDHQIGRIGVLVLGDGPTGLEVGYFDTPSPACASGAAGCVAFRETPVAGGLTRGDAHTVRLTLDFVEGPDNDVARVYVDGALRFTGESWENYYRNDPEAIASTGGRIPLIDTLALRINSQANTAPDGLLIDNVRVQTSAPAGTTVLPSPPSPVPGEQGAPTPMRILAASMSRRTGIIRARLVCPPEAGNCAASVTVRGDGNVRMRRDLVRSAGKRVTLHLKPTESNIRRLLRADKVTITVFSRNGDGIGSRVRQRLPRM